ncbi:phosphate ABC transporter substrate-binding protein [Pediococcus argentinicus]|uniref:Phosphate-binding protein n=1 Tax=Pediococcus argentinicus TaxID=480391 RepID=A0A0R2NPF5_9LACO|nr:phosphate ABC transporter substrate-binding protein [Pediococcus argentinicus]KRO25747.1 ABC-type phosphate transport system, periplasmic component [Pediococcus argentinicus]NKZ21913.1 phosphate ABC transporter substrate-binding protein [Pediococcus argentinicus]GEP19082.1 phosphate ABC transporter substrate-binding protein [Pediococcus argentinicus]
MHKILTKLIQFSLIAIIPILLAGCGGRSGSSVTIVGSTALQPLVEKAAADYQVQHSNVNITVQGGGSGTGLSQVQQKAVSVGNSDVFAEQQDGIKASKLEDHKVAVVGMGPVVNKDVSIKNLSMKQLKDIFTGKIKNWKEVGGNNLPIVVINRAQGSGIRKSFERVVLDGKQPMNAQEQDSNGTVQKIVEATPGAISYLSFSYFNNQVKSLTLEQVKPNAANVATNKWKIWSYEHMYTQKNASKETTKFIDYMQSKAVQQKLITDLGYISIHDMKVQMDANNKITPVKGGDH